MSRQTTSGYWVRLAAAAHREQDPEKFMQLIKQLYDVVNTREDEQDLNGEAITRGDLQRAA